MTATVSIIAFLPLFLLLSPQSGTAATCADWDGVCRGSHGSQADCCAGLYCHKPNPDWALGRCYLRPKECGQFGK